ncbi:prepilin-type N-terminal cleavage/methylation domain-containing protein [Paenibacillus sp. FSL P2-0089]|uniref:prepilin-type N-terminal cleavage/methylation domain-containing protein n=1 Tax=Paenibacillus sp. FSL P2-0089 TaxID=2954526 RepID=UPI00315A5218
MLAQALRKRLGKAVKEEKGFTLIELLAVIVIIGIIAVIAVPLISNVIGKSKSNADVATARQIYDAARLYITSEKAGKFTGTDASGNPTALNITIGPKSVADSLQKTGFLESPIYLPSTKLEIVGGTVQFDATGTFIKVVLDTGATDPPEFLAAEVMSATPTANR